MTLAQALQSAMADGVERLDAQLLLLHALGRSSADRAWLLARDRDPLEAAARQTFQGLCRRRQEGEPAAYLLGHKEFHGLELRVDARVLVPRPDTETLVDWALELLQGRESAKVIDLGTGSGAIALALAHARRDLQVEAVDASTEALEVAKGNADRLGLEVVFRRGDWLDATEGRLDMIVANPPYIAEDDPHLPALGYEPRQALVAGADGLADLRRIVQAAPAHLAAGGWVLLEHGWHQAGAVRTLLGQAGFSDVVSRRDLAGIERCSGGRRLERG